MCKSNYIIFLIGTFCLIFQSCNNSHQKSTAEEVVRVDTTNVGEGDSVLFTYWDRHDFSNNNFLANLETAEQLLVDYLALLPRHHATVIDVSMQKLYNKMGQNEQIHQFFLDKMEFYLYHPNSPMLNEAYFESFLKAVVKDDNLDVSVKHRYATLLTLVSLNKPGEMASDFEYFIAGNSKRRLSDSNGKQRLLLFYDLTCSHCAEVIRSVAESALFSQRIQEGKLDIIAIEPLATMDDWQLYSANIPKFWVHGVDKDKNIIKNQLFNLRAYPSMYLIDADGRVLLRDAQLGQILDVMQNS